MLKSMSEGSMKIICCRLGTFPFYVQSHAYLKPPISEFGTYTYTKVLGVSRSRVLNLTWVLLARRGHKDDGTQISLDKEIPWGSHTILCFFSNMAVMTDLLD